MSRNRVRIHNPVPGTAPFTSAKRAAHFCRRGLAFMNGDELEFFGPGPGFYSRLAESGFDRAIEEGRGGDRIYWNGSAGRNKMKKPGQVRS